MHTNIYAWTAMGSIYPEYVSVNDDDGTMSLAVRAVSRPQASGHAWPGPAADIALTDEQATELAFSLLRHIVKRRTPGAAVVGFDALVPLGSLGFGVSPPPTDPATEAARQARIRFALDNCCSAVSPCAHIRTHEALCDTCWAARDIATSHGVPAGEGTLGATGLKYPPGPVAGAGLGGRGPDEEDVPGYDEAS